MTDEGKDGWREGGREGPCPSKADDKDAIGEFS